MMLLSRVSLYVYLGLLSFLLLACGAQTVPPGDETSPAAGENPAAPAAVVVTPVPIAPGQPGSAQPAAAPAVAPTAAPTERSDGSALSHPQAHADRHACGGASFYREHSGQC